MTKEKQILVGEYRLSWRRAIPYVLFLALISLLVFGCKKEEAPAVQSPGNLEVTVTEDDNSKGLVKIKATATNTNFFSFQITEDGEKTYEENNTGEYTYQFTKSGSHNIRVRAHVLANNYAETNKVFTVDFDTSNGGGGLYPTTGYTTPTSYPGYNLVWQDEFDGTALNEADWNYEIGTGNSGWGNNELQYYLKENLAVENGILTITAKKQQFNTSAYTSSRITTEGKQSFQYGRIDIRAAMPYGQGMWPALWMLGENIRTVSWPACGEIDIMEMVGGTPATAFGDNTTHGTLHWNENGHANYGEHYTHSGRLHDEWHVYTITWDKDFIRWYFDDKAMHAIDIRPAGMDEFRAKFFFIMNVAVGGNWPGSPDASTVFPQQMHVDYVRVFQKQ